MHDIFKFANPFDWVIERLYKDYFHFFSIIEQKVGRISTSVPLHYNLSPFGSSIFLGANIIECPSQVEEKTKNCLEGLNHESYSLLPSMLNSHYFYDPIAVLMDEVCKNLSQPWYDFISHHPYLSLIFKQ